MKAFLSNILLAFTWVAVTGLFEPINFIIGFALAYVILWMIQRSTAPSNYFSKVYQVLSFSLFFGRELVKANLRVAHDIVTPYHHMRPGVVDIPLDVQTDEEITLLANLITLTPGTLSLDVSTDRKVLYIHAMYIDHVEEFRRSIKEGLERRVMEVLR
ncbi:Na+/H+ antiporter subunit E [Desulforhabdus amnigena]|uniref:Cation:proton antiporter n=1 Tax=Desulforhabdus amnigena TaxID=40218 RepID=A0A9W6L931_9BACT|nr:Na+/H+ antiporter subunit E [Desulforhabdus amnigena]GLI36222.1 cation:proton antiporter [Desulforhabdus amnigena]